MANNLHEIFKAAQTYRVKNNFDMDEADLNRHLEKTREGHWHHSLALAVDDLDLSSLKKLELFSECIRNMDSEILCLRGTDKDISF